MIPNIDWLALQVCLVAEPVETAYLPSPCWSAPPTSERLGTSRSATWSCRGFTGIKKCVSGIGFMKKSLLDWDADPPGVIIRSSRPAHDDSSDGLTVRAW